MLQSDVKMNEWMSPDAALSTVGSEKPQKLKYQVSLTNNSLQMHLKATSGSIAVKKACLIK